MSVADSIRPVDAQQLREVVAGAPQSGAHLEARAGGSKRDIGRPGRQTAVIDLSAFSGVVDYEPSELVLTVRPATPLAEVESLLHARGQMLAFEPFDHGPLFGRAPGAATIGGVVAAGVAGPRRVSAGGARDHLLGFAGVSGRGELFKGGGKVVKNVTGYDLSKAMAGSWGQLAILTEITLKVMPRPRAGATVVLRGLSDAAAIAAMARAMGSHCAVSAAAHLRGEAEGAAVTALRLEGFSESVALRADRLGGLLAEFGAAELLAPDMATDFWAGVAQARPLWDGESLWRLHAAPSRAAALAARLSALGARWFYDWAGALVWVAAPAGADVRAAAEAVCGHAMLVRGPAAMRAATSALHPQPPGVAALTDRLRRAFDPARILDPHRFD